VHDVVSSEPSGGWRLWIVAFDRKLVSQPIDLARFVIVNFLESKRFEPARGSWA
jgi:hypothetical protein